MTINQGKPCHKGNYTAQNSRNIKYIVIHYTAGNGDSASGNCNYSANGKHGASVHYFVGDDGIYQSVQDKDRAWHCGSETGKYKHPACRNANSIGIEMCSRKDGNGKYYIKSGVTEMAAELTRYLMNKYGIPKENVVRHYDVTGKACPEPFVRDTAQWNNFKERLEDNAMTSEEKAKFNELVNTVSELKATVDKLANPMIYNYIDGNMPDWARPTVQKLVDKGMLQGDENGLNLTDSDLRHLVINDRAGLYDRG